MATITPTITHAGNHTKIFTWAALTAANAVGHPIPPQYADYVDRCIHILGTFDSATVVWQGSNDGTNYLTLDDAHDVAISKTAADIEQVNQSALYQRPSTSGGGGSQSITVIAVCRRGRGGKEI